MDAVNETKLNLMLREIRETADEERFIRTYVRPYRSAPFHVYLQRYMAGHDIPLAEVMNNSRINKNYGYNIVNGTRRNPGRDKVLALCIGAGMSFDEVQMGLRSAGLPPLDPRDERDVRIAVAVNNGVTDVLKINLKLEENGLEPLRC